jgi:hypothetical protein
LIRPARATERRPRVARFAALAGAVAISTVLASPLAYAQEGASSIAEQLFVEGKALMQEQQYERACEKFQASHDLDHTATGTLLNLALCHETLGRSATAWTEFRQVAAESAVRREDRVKLAREHEAKLFPTLSRIRIFVPPDTRVEGLSLRLDKGPPVAPASWGTELPIDPGKHTIEATAPGKRPRVVDFVVGKASDRQTVAVEPLEDAPVAPIGPEDAQAARERERLATLRGRRIVGFTLGGVGLAAAGVGLAFGAVASSKNKEVADTCPNDFCSDSGAQGRAESSLSSAKTFATLSNISVGVGAALLVTGVVLVLTAQPGKGAAPSSVTAASSVRILPAPVASGGALLLSGEL